MILAVSPHTEAGKVSRLPSGLTVGLASTAIAIACIGIASLYSVAGGQMEPWAMPHLVRLIGGIATMLLLALVPQRLWELMAFPIYALALAALIAVAVAGTESYGARRWLSTELATIQPAEAMKLALVLALARLYQIVPPRAAGRPLRVALALGLIAVPTLLILRQPDLGTALLLVGLGGALMFLAGVPLGYFAAAGLAVGLTVPRVWEHLHEYQRQRILVFLDPDLDPTGRGYQIVQSKIALGSGGFAGKGFLQGTQTQLDFLPEKHTDFIFAMYAEELGFLGGVLLLALFALLIGLLVLMALRCRGSFARLVIAGVAVLLFLHVFVNVAMVSGLLPVVGVPLPLVSFGGSSMLATLAGLGLALGAYRHRRIADAHPTQLLPEDPVFSPRGPRTALDRHGR